MTREEAKSCICTIKMLQKLAYNIHGVMDVVDADNCKKIIKALEQEPCEDCISRQAVLNTLFYKSDNNCEVVLNKELQDRIKALPSVTPKPKMGQWIYDKTIENWWCSECNETPKIMGYVGTADFMAEHFRFCNHCGTKMEVEEC